MICANIDARVERVKMKLKSFTVHFVRLATRLFCIVVKALYRKETHRKRSELFTYMIPKYHVKNLNIYSKFQ